MGLPWLGLPLHTPPLVAAVVVVVVRRKGDVAAKKSGRYLPDFLAAQFGIHVGIRECHGFVNPCRCNLRASEGAGMGWDLVTLVQPVPVRRDSRAARGW